MSNLHRTISTGEESLGSFVNLLAEERLLIPSFQRKFVREPEDIVKLWNSI